ncbi:MAG: hypothetical protein L0I62_07715, partial [Gammaproteobacteria bacterium]|nr:hypothetical protein [Gammaproteobacteria bacterium]
LELAGLPVLREMLEILARQPHLSTAGLLEYWRERPEAAQLGRLAAAEPLLLEADRVVAEFRDALGDLERAPRQVRLTELERQPAQTRLGEAERQELGLLHRIRGLESRPERTVDQEAEYERLLAEYRQKYCPEVPETP